MALCTEKSVIYHIPKCGGSWVKEAIKRSGIEFHLCHEVAKHEWGLGRNHSTPANIDPNCRDGKFAFCFVRMPVEWYRSIWSYRMKKLRQGRKRAKKFPADWAWDDDPGKFANNLCDLFPNGFVSELYENYTPFCNYVGHQENLREDLAEALALAGEDFDPIVLQRLGKKNSVASLPQWQRECTLSPKTQRRIERVEHRILETWYA